MINNYPQIWGELQTLQALPHKSIARFGDGEWRCAVGGGCTSQRADPRLAAELRDVLKSPGECLVGLPNLYAPEGAPRRASWAKYAEPKFSALCGAKTYASSFITRPDNAPWIDTPDYWERVRDLWRGQDVVLVAGDKKSITTEMIGSEAKSVREVIGPRQHAYAEIDRIERDIGKTRARVLLCLGTCATVLAWRLTKKGIHALDLGHIGMFMRHEGAYRYSVDDLSSDAYRQQLHQLHRSRKWGADGAKHTDAVRGLHAKYQPKTILDYGCGENRLAESLAAEFRISGYDPGIEGREKMPKPCDLVVCTDVLEHIEPDKLDAVLDHVRRITGAVAYFVIDTKPANAVLPDGRNAHLSLHSAQWWLDKLLAQGWKLDYSLIGSKSITVVALK